jgi:hypothetical protein
MRAKSGGGINSNKRVEVGVRRGTASADKVSPGGVSQLGSATGDRLRAPGAHTGQPTSVPVFVGTKPQAAILGNQKASDVGKGGPGSGRTVYRTGYQSLRGPVAGSPKPQGRDFLGGLGLTRDCHE